MEALSHRLLRPQDPPEAARGAVRLAARDLSPMVAVCVLDSRPGAVVSECTGETVDAGTPLFRWPTTS